MQKTHLHEKSVDGEADPLDGYLSTSTELETDSIKEPWEQFVNSSFHFVLPSTK